MWVTLLPWFCVGLCVAVPPGSGHTNYNQQSADRKYDENSTSGVTDTIQQQPSSLGKPQTQNTLQSLEELVDDIFNSITSSYPDIINSNTGHPSNINNDSYINNNGSSGSAKDECKDLNGLQNLVKNIYKSIKKYKENSKSNTNSINNFQESQKSPNHEHTPKCRCVKYDLCKDFVLQSDAIDVHGPIPDEEKCPSYLQVCCRNISEGPVSTGPPKESTKPRCGRRLSSEDDGDLARPGEFPWMVNVTDSSTFCGGSLIHPKVVLTAAHCVDGKEKLVVEVGDRQEVQVKEVVVHNKFNNGSLANDPALLILTSDVTLSETVGLICLPDVEEPMDGRRCIASGWGNGLQSNESQEGRDSLKRVGPLPIVARPECQESLRKTKLGDHFKLHETFICAGGIPGKDTCKGDGGSPLVCPRKTDPDVFVQAGIVAWGISCGTGTPGVYVNVPYFVSWIEDQLRVKGVVLDQPVITDQAILESISDTSF